MRPNSNSNKWLGLAAGVALAAAIVVLIARGDNEPPAESRLVQDSAALMTPGQRAFIARFHGFLIDDHDIDYRVVTASDTGDINLFAVTRFKSLFARSRSKTGRGLLLVVDPAQDRVRLEVAYALEGVFPDAFVAYVENRQMVPFFRTGRIADGILAATELIVTRAQRAAANAGFEDEPWATASGGGGAVARTRIGQGRETIEPRGPRPVVATTRTPAEILQAYFDAMSARIASPDLDFYTPATRQMLRSWTVTRAQMDSVVKTYRNCSAQDVQTGPDGKRAVIRYPISQRACAPFFFERVDGNWALDLTMMQRAIRFGRTNAWHFDPTAKHPYRFAFEDWRFDKYGFPKGTR